MSQSAPSELPVAPDAPAADAAESEEVSGRFKIAAAPPETKEADADAATTVSSDDVESLADAELEVIAAIAAPKTSSLRVSMPPPVPLIALTKSSAPKPAPDATLNLEPALEPFYRGVSASERAEPEVDDLSFRLDNPFARSSLVPPPRKPFPWLKVVGGTAGAAVLALGGYFFGMQQLNSARVEGPASAPHAAVASAAVVASAPTVVPAPVTVVAAAPVPPPAAAVPAPVPEKVELPVAVAKPAATNVGASVKKPETKPEPQPTQPADETAKTSVAAAPDVAPKEPAAAPAAEAPAAEAPTAAPEEDLPETPTRDQIMASFEKVRSEIETCAAGGHGIATTNVTISGAGRVTYAMVEGVFAGTPQGSCMARAVRGASFPHFSAPNFKVSYPFSL